MARLGLIGSTNNKATSGVYNLGDVVSRQDAKNYLTNYSYDGVFNPLTAVASPTGFTFTPDGLTMYVVNNAGTRTGTSVFIYSLTRPFDLSTLTYTGTSYVVGDFDLTANCIAYDPETGGVNISGNTSDAIWFLQNADGSTIPYVKFYVGTQDATQQSLKILPSSGGSYKIYTLGTTNRRVYQYTTYDNFGGASYEPVFNATTYDNKSLLVSGQDATPQGIHISPDGSSLYMVGSTSDSIYSYNLSTPYDVSTATTSYVSTAATSILVTAQATTQRNDVVFGDSGTKMYVLAGGTQATDTVFQYNVGTAWSVTSATYSGISANIINTLDVTNESLFFKSDGSKMYVLGNTNDIVHSYSLGTPWNVGTATSDYVPKSFSHSAQTTTQSKVTFGDNGTKMYVLSGGGATTDTVFQYNLGTAWDVTTSTYSGLSTSVNAQDGTAQGIAFNSDGSYMYMVGSTTDAVYQYSLSTPWQINTATALFASSSSSYLVSAQTTAVAKVAFGDNGSKMYVLSSTTADTVFQYSLAAPWDVTTASYAVPKSFAVTAQDGVAQGIIFDTNGQYMYMIGSGTDAIYRYTLGTPWDVSTASYTTHSLSVAAQETEPRALYINPNNGQDLYIIGQTSDAVHQYYLSTPWNLTTGSFVRSTASLVEGAPTGLCFSPDGLRMHTIGQTNDTVREYTLSVAWDISTISLYSISPIGHLDATATSIVFGNDGYNMYISGDTGDRIHQVYLSAPYWSNSIQGRLYIGDRETEPRAIWYDTNSGIIFILGQTNDTVYQYFPNGSTFYYVSSSPNIGEATSTGLYLTPTGSYGNGAYGQKMYVVGTTSQRIREYGIPDTFNVSSAVFLRELPISFLDTAPTTITFKGDGTVMYVAGDTGDRVHQLPLGTAWRCTNVVGRLYVGNEETTPTGMYIDPNGLYLYIVGQTSDRINAYNMSVTWDVSTGNNDGDYNGLGRSPVLTEATATGIHFSDDGSKVFVVGSTGQRISEYSLAYNWDVRDISISAVRDTPIGFIDTSPQGIYFKSDGTSLYIMGNTNGRVYQTNLTSAWNTSSSLVFNGRYYVGEKETEPRAIYISPDGYHMFVSGQTSDLIHQYYLTTSGNINSAYFVRSSASIVEATITAFQFSDDGYALWLVGTTNDAIRYYTLSEAWNVSTLSFVSSTSVGFEATPTGIWIYGPNSGNQYTYIMGITNDTIYRLYSGTGNDLYGVNYIGATEGTVRGLALPDPSRNEMFISGSGGVRKLSYPDQTNGFSLAEPATFLQTYAFTGAGGISFNYNGTKLYIATFDTAANGGRQIRQVDLSIPYDLTTAVLNSTELIALYGLTGAITTGTQAIYMTPDSSRMFVLSSVVKGLYQFSLKF